jgi:CRP-like cAMP-binding protein
MNLERFPLFAALGEEERELVAAAAEEVEMPVGEHLTREGDFGYQFFAIVEGPAEVRRDGQLVGELGPGDVFGEVALLITGRRVASVTALTPMRLVVLFQHEFHRLERRVPALGKLLREQSWNYLSSPGASG